eukprot:11360680-Karenia_brevis.AAC.1
MGAARGMGMEASPLASKEGEGRQGQGESPWKGQGERQEQAKAHASQRGGPSAESREGGRQPSKIQISISTAAVPILRGA